VPTCLYCQVQAIPFIGSIHVIVYAFCMFNVDLGVLSKN
jgi:hypothetical protein